MGAWGEGLYDNDGALDELGGLIDTLPLRAGAVPMATSVGLITWLQPSASQRVIEVVCEHPDWVSLLSKQVQELLHRFVHDTKAFTAGRSRSTQLTEILGGYCDGPRYDALLTLEGSAKVIAKLGRAAAERLEDGLQSATDLYEASRPIGNLGVLLELAERGYWSPRTASLKEWRLSVDPPRRRDLGRAGVVGRLCASGPTRSAFAEGGTRGSQTVTSWLGVRPHGSRGAWRAVSPTRRSRAPSPPTASPGVPLHFPGRRPVSVLDDV